MKKCLLAGLGKSNEAMRPHLKREGYLIFTYDEKRPADYDYRRLKKELPIFDLVVISPGIKYNSAPYRLLTLLGLKITGELGYSLQLLKGKLPIIGVTGSNGKTTTVTLLTALLKKIGFKVMLGGNIGTPMADFIDSLDCYDIAVVEISSYQAQLVLSELDILIFTSLAPNHLDSYNSLAEYYASKKRLIAFSKTFITSKNVLEELKIESNDGIKLVTCDFCNSAALDFEYALLAVQELGHEISDLKDYPYMQLVPPSRNQHFLTYKSLEFYDDSKSTSLEATLAALKSDKRKTLLILGGHLKSKISQEIKADRIIIYGSEREKFLSVAKGMMIEDLSKVVEYIKNTVDPDIYCRILFSPGGATNDYGSYLERGAAYKKMIRDIYEL